MVGLLMFNPGVSELMTNTGCTHVVPQEVIEQAEDHQVLEFAARWAYKAHLIDHAELSEAVAKQA